VLQVRDLLADVLRDTKVRRTLLGEAMDVVASDPVAEALHEMEVDDLVRCLIEGFEELPGPLARTLNESGFALPPLPNLYFTRDTAMGLNDHVLVGSMRYDVRWSEELIMSALYRHHPLLANAGILYDGSAERRVNHTLEGGDVHPIRRDTLMIGFSERSSPAAIDGLAELLYAHTSIEQIIVVVMPRENTAIHLDMIFTMVDRDLCVVHPPHFVGSERLSVLLWRKGQAELREMPNVFAALQACGITVEPIFCGGERRIVQEREQWASGCNFLAVRPGVVLSYARNEATLREMERMGFRIVGAAPFLTGEDRIEAGERAVITFEGSELVRGGGGPRCMSCPVTREDPWA
jgi:arginine deiminase